MRLEKILIFPGEAETSRVTSEGSQIIPARVANQSDDFARELALGTPAEIRVEDGPELPPPSDGTIFVCAPEVLERSLARRHDRNYALSSRTVVYNVVRTDALNWAEQFALAGVIETRQYFNWLNRRNEDNPAALYGRKDVARSFGATWPDLALYHGERYALLSHPAYPRLPALLAAYLHDYVKLL